MSFDVAWQVACRSWRAVFRRPVVLTFSFVQPLVWMAFFGFLFQRFPLIEGEGESYLQFLAPGVCAMTVLFGASQSGISWIRDLQTGILPRMLRTPASRHGILGGKILADVTRVCLQAWVVLGLSGLLGARFELSGLPLLLGFFGLVLFAAAFSAVSCAIALRTRAQEAMATFVHVVNMPLLFTSTALVPHRQMPGWLAELARVNPLSLAVDGWRGALLRAELPRAEGLWILAGMAFGLYFVAWLAMAKVMDLE